MLKKRFIAGAVCPRCAKMDKLMMFDDEQGQRRRECVSCGFTDTVEDIAPLSEPVTRVNQPRVEDHQHQSDADIQPIRVLSGMPAKPE